MSQHWYWCIKCKTPGCPELQALRYLGPEQDVPEDADGAILEFPAEPVPVRCPTCRTVHLYEMEDVVPRKLPLAPSPGFETIF